MADSDRTRVLIAGGGITGLETLLALSELAADRVELTLAAPDDEFVLKPLLVDEQFSATPAERHELAPIVAERGGEFVRGTLTAVRPAERTAEIAGGGELGYDALVVCVGAVPRAAFAGAVTLPSAGRPLDVDGLLRRAAEHEPARIAFLLPPRGSWPLPAYELALLADRRARALGLAVTVAVVTPEASPLIAFGRAASDAVGKLCEARGIELVLDARAEEGDGAIVVRPGGERLAAGAVVALPELEGPRIAGLPSDERGFIPIDERARVVDLDAIYAAGDGTNFPIKHGGLGCQQADAAAEDIAARAGADVEPEPFRPVLRGKLITGDESLHLAADPTGGEPDGSVSPDPLWWPPNKVAGRYLAAFLAGSEPHGLEPPPEALDVEVALPREWHREPMALDPYEPIEP